MIELFDLLPRIYHVADENGELEDFLSAFQTVLELIHDDEEQLRTIASIFDTPAKYLKYIARSLGWKLQSKTEEKRRNECASIIDYYDLKGTPYGLRLVSKLTLDKLFKRIAELYTPNAASASNITETAGEELQYLLDGDGVFVSDDWSSYNFDPFYSYIVFIRIDPNDYVFGSIRQRIKAFKNAIHTLHPAGRYCYPYIVCEGLRNEHYSIVQQVYEEITGLKTYDDEGFLDDAGAFDENDEPIDESVSTRFYKDWVEFDTLDEDATPAPHEWDDDGFLDDGQWEVHAIFEIS